MWLRQFLLESLGHASYLLGDDDAGEALLIDPRRDVDIYFEAARNAGVRIAYVLDTHAHNDYVSGVTEVLERQPATALGYAGAELGYPHRALPDRATLALGDVELELVHTPGHTPTHVAVVARAGSGNAAPVLLSGGALLVGGTGRPDLLGGPEQAREGARAIHDTLNRRLRDLADDVEVYPTHVAGSLCGAGLERGTWTTLGHERRTGKAFTLNDPERFADDVLAPENLPAVPPYWRRMGPINRAGPPPLGVLPEPPALRADEVERAAGGGAVIVDARSPDAFAAGHVPRSLSVGAGPNFATWAGTVLDEGARVALVLGHPQDLWPLTWELLRIGASPPLGWLAGGLGAWRDSGRAVAQLESIDVHEAAARSDVVAGGSGEHVILVDVRQPTEWAEGTVDGALLVTGAELPGALDRLPAGKQLAMICRSGYRSTTMASVLAAAGHPVCVVAGGMNAWRGAGLPVTHGR